MSKRERILRGLRAYFSRDRMPRLVMGVILLFTAGAGFFCSRFLLGAGLESMPVRYLLSTLAAWCVLIALVRLWIEVERRALSSPEDLAHIAESHGDEDEDHSWERAGDAAANTLDAAMNAADDEAGCVIALLVPAVAFLLVGLVFGVSTLVIGAPGLLAEVFLDVVVAGFLSRGLRTHNAQWWAYGVIRRTWKIAVPLAVLLGVLGWALQKWSPGIRTLGDLFR